VVLFLGTSLTAGFGVGADSAYPAFIAARIDSLGLPFRVVNAGLSGETSAGGLRRLEWSLQEPVSVLVVELGANDGLRGLSVEEMRRNLEQIIRRTRERHPGAGIVLAGMEAPPNMGAPYTTAFRDVYASLTREYGTALVPFLLEGVAGDPALNQDDRIHPTSEGQKRVADNVWRVLGPLLREQAGGASS
jgi:acyl-CoA thioesterase-1